LIFAKDFPDPILHILSSCYSLEAVSTQALLGWRFQLTARDYQDAAKMESLAAKLLATRANNLNKSWLLAIHWLRIITTDSRIFFDSKIF
jgi:hypothetical protein